MHVQPIAPVRRARPAADSQKADLLEQMDRDALVENRYRKFRAMGAFIAR